MALEEALKLLGELLKRERFDTARNVLELLVRHLRAGGDPKNVRGLTGVSNDLNRA